MIGVLGSVSWFLVIVGKKYERSPAIRSTLFLVRLWLRCAIEDRTIGLTAA